ncbi:MAG: MFS transporter [Nitrososphaerota archaeon]|nr:MFS transporter [Aigarchaeota archaeon]MDW8076348.1 MFS transporter [Nitrososphaerota archaeon]
MQGWKRHHTIWLTMILGWISIYMIRMAPSSALSSIKQEFNLSYTEAGLLANAYFYTYLPAQFPSGWIGDRFGRRLVLSLSSMLWGVLSILTAFVSNFHQFLVARMATGVVQGLYFGNDRPTVAAYTPKGSAGIGQGISFIGIGLGTVLGMYLGGLITSLMGWRWMFVFFAIPSFIVSIIMFIVLKDVPSNGNDGLRSFSELLKNRDFLLMCLAGIPCIYTFWVLATWAPTIFMEVGIGDLSTSSLLASILGITAVPSLIFMGYLSDTLKKKGIRRKLITALDITLMSVFLFLFGYAMSTNSAPILLVAFYTIIGLLYWGFVAPLYAMLQETVPTRLHGTAFGLMNGIHFIGSLISPWFTGLMRDITGNFVWSIYIPAAMLLFSSLIITLISPAFSFKERVTKL